MPEQYLTESHYLVCDKGVAPKKMKVTSQNFVTISGAKVATVQDTLRDNNFVCLGKTAFMAGVAAGVAVGICALFPGPGWLVAAIIAAAVIAAAAVGYMKCKAACGQRIWNNTAERFSISGKKVLTLSSVMICPAEGGVITPKETFWSAWGSAALTNLGHAANFAFGFLVGRGATGMVTGAGQAAAGATTIRQGASTFAKELGSQFLNTAKTELVEQFTFKGIKNASTFCKIMRGLGIGGAYYEQYNIWSSDKSLLDKVKESGIGLILSIFAAKGATYVCFPAGTKVHTKDGLRDIEDIREGELLLTCNVETQENEYKPVLVRHERFTLQMLSLELPTGEMLCVTPEHRFYSNGSWVEARDLRAGDLLQLKEKNCYTTLISVETLPHYEKVYNFDIADNENYYVTEDGILVHNGYREEYVGRTPSKSSKTGREVFDRMLNSDPPLARVKDEFGNAVKQFWDPDNKIWRDISEADMGHIHDAVTYWNETGRYLGAKSKEVRKWMLDSDNYILEYFSTNRSKGAKLGKTATYLPPVVE